MQSNILITGGTGFIGSKLIEDPYFSDALFVGRARPSGAKNYVRKNLLVSEDYDEELNSIDTVIHLAGIAHSNDPDKLQYIHEFNTHFTIYLASRAACNDVKRFIFMSSIKVLGDVTHGTEKFDCDSKYAPSDEYAKSKVNAEIALLKIADESNMQVVIVRPPLVVGVDAKGNLDKILKYAKLGIPLPFLGVENMRSTLCVTDLTDLLRHCVVDDRVANKIIMPKSGLDKSTPKILSDLAKLQNQRLKLFWLPAWLLKGVLMLFGGSAMMKKITGSLEIDSSYLEREIGWVSKWK